MKSVFSFRRSRPEAAFTLTELVVAVGILLVGGAIAFPFLTGDMSLYIRNFSINKSNNSLRTSLQNLKRDVNMSIEPPLLATRTIISGTVTVTPLADSTTYADAIICWVNLGPNYQMLAPSGSTTGYIKPSSGITIVRHIASSGSDNTKKEDGCAPLPQVGDRILIMSPGPYTTGMPESVSGILKPGRRITSVTSTGGTPLSPTDTTTTNFVIKVDETNTPLPTTNGVCTVPGNNSVTFFREVVYAVNTINDANLKPAERQLLYYPTTADLTKPKILIRDLDPDPQETDANLAGKVLQPFNYYGGRTTLSALSVNLPIRALDYSHPVGDRNLAAGQTNISSEFNLYLRSSTVMSIKARLDDNSLTQIAAK